MNKHHWWTCIVFVALFSCQRENLLDRMEYIKQVGNTDPQRALCMLDSIKLKVRSESDFIQKKYDLLDVRLHDKADMLPTSDMMVKELVAYFEEQGDDAEKQEVHYYAGSVYRDLHDTPRALEHFLKALEIGLNGKKCDSLLLRNTYSNLNFLYYQVQDYQHALPMAKEECRLSKALNKLNALDMIHVGAALTRLDSINSAKRAFRSALQLFKKNALIRQRGNALSSLLYHFSRFRMLSEAQECYEIIQEHNTLDSYSSDYFLSLGEYYSLTHQTDSVIACYQRIITDSVSLEGMYDASKLLFLLYEQEGNAAEANRYARFFVDISDSLNLGKRQELAATTNNEYQYHRNIEEERKVKEEKERYRNLLIGISLISAIVILTLFLVFTRRKNRRLKAMLAMQNELRHTQKDKQKLEDELTQKETELNGAKASLEKMMADLDSVNEKLTSYDKELAEKEKMLTAKMEQNKMFIRLLHQAELESTAEDVVQAVRQSSEGKRKMSLTDWNQLYRAVDELYPTFKDTFVKKLGAFSEQQMQVAYLMRIGLSNTQIENLTDVSHATIWRWVKKFNEAFFAS